MSFILKDSHGRVMKKLRISLLDACNLRCIYCMPENPCFLDENQLLTTDEIFRLAKILNNYGIDEIRLTGGEPTLRRNFIEVIERLSDLPLQKLALTTNGTFIHKFWSELEQSKCQNLNFSLDTLNEKNFKTLTQSSQFQRVYHNILSAKERGFNVKINAVMMRGLNDHEVYDFLEFSALTGIEVRFLEVMKIGVMKDQFNERFISAQEMINSIGEKYKLTAITRPYSSTSFNFNAHNGAQIGFIASESQPFCSDCSRLRIGAKGELRPCLMVDHGVSLVGLSEDEILETLNQTIQLKPIVRPIETHDGMYSIGG